MFDQPISLDQPGKVGGQPVPAARDAATLNAWPAAGVGPHVAPATAQDPGELQPELVGQPPDLMVRFLNQVAAGFRVLGVGEPVPDRPHAATEAAARFDNRDIGAATHQIAGGREAGKTSARHEHRDAIERSIHRRSVGIG